MHYKLLAGLGMIHVARFQIPLAPPFLAAGEVRARFTQGSRRISGKAEIKVLHMQRDLRFIDDGGMQIPMMVCKFLYRFLNVNLAVPPLARSLAISIYV